MQYKGISLRSMKILYFRFNSSNLYFVTIRRCNQSSSYRNPYDVLGLKKTCSTEDVKKAYIKLCKKHHPDMKPGDASQHKKFVELNNAYTTLINTESRKNFDQKPDQPFHNTNYDIYRKTSGPFDQGSWQREQAWYEREDYQQYYNPKNKYSSRGKRIDNKWILSGCFLLVVIGSFLYYCAYSYATRYKLEKVDARSKKIRENYQDVLEKAVDGEREEKLEKLKRRWSM